MLFKAAGKRDPNAPRNLQGGTGPRADRSAPRAPKSRPKSTSERQPPGGFQKAISEPQQKAPPVGVMSIIYIRIRIRRKRISHPSGNDFRTIAILRKRLQYDPCFQGDCVADKPPPNRPTQLETLAAKARVATVPTQLSDSYGDGQKVEKY